MKVVKLTKSGVPNYTKARQNGLKVLRKVECRPTSWQVRKQLTFRVIPAPASSKPEAKAQAQLV